MRFTRGFTRGERTRAYGVCQTRTGQRSLVTNLELASISGSYREGRRFKSSLATNGVFTEGRHLSSPKSRFSREDRDVVYCALIRYSELLQ
jgi:hypothetical protein